jgi:hypothetical protein
VADPSDLDVIDGLQHSLGRPVEIMVASEDDLQAAIGRYYGAKDDSVSKMIQDITEGEVEIGKIGEVGVEDGAAVEADAPIIKLVNTIIVDAFKMRRRTSTSNRCPASSAFATALTVSCTR